jgi:protein SCO1/2
MITRRAFLTNITASVGVASAGTSDALGATAPVHRGPRAGYFPNVTVSTHEGKQVRFYDELICGKIVVINMMYADCTGICPAMTANLVKVQQALGPRVGRDIFMYSITLQPKDDTPAVLNTYVQHHGVGPGWTFLTGRPADIEILRRRLGFVDPDPVLDLDKANHTGVVRFGNEAIDSWGACPALGSAEQIVKAILWMDVQPKKSAA